MEEQQYLQLIRDILSKGHNEVSRNGNVRSLFGYSMRFSLQNGHKIIDVKELKISKRVDSLAFYDIEFELKKMI